MGMVFGLTYNNGTYFGINPSSIFGIHLLPVTPAQSYMGYNQKYAQSIYAKYRFAQDRYQKYLADKGTPDYDPEGWYLQNMDSKGSFCDEIWSDNYTSYQVFKKDGKYTATVWNPSAEPVKVSFRNKDGQTAEVTVAANCLVDVDPTKSGSYGDSAPAADLYEEVYGVPGRINATDYTSNFTCSRQDEGCMGAIKNKSALTYQIDVEEEGEYIIDYRMKSIRDTTGRSIRAKTDLSDDTLSKVSFVNDKRYQRRCCDDHGKDGQWKRSNGSRPCDKDRRTGEDNYPAGQRKWKNLCW